MGHCNSDECRRNGQRGTPKKVGTKRPFTQKQIWAIRFFLDRERRVRDRALLISQSTASFAGVTWSRSGCAM